MCLCPLKTSKFEQLAKKKLKIDHEILQPFPATLPMLKISRTKPAQFFYLKKQSSQLRQNLLYVLNFINCPIRRNKLYYFSLLNENSFNFSLRI